MFNVGRPLSNTSEKVLRKFYQFLHEFQYTTNLNQNKTSSNGTDRLMSLNTGYQSIEDEFTPDEIRRIFDETVITEDGSELFNIKLSVIKDYEIMKLEYTRDMPLELLINTTCYLIDTQSHLGIFVWMGKESGMEVRLECAKRAEQYLRNMRYDNDTKIHFVSQEDIEPAVQTVDQFVRSRSH